MQPDSQRLTLESLRLLTPYLFARRTVAGKRVLEIGTGGGLGVAMLNASQSCWVVALDVDEDLVRQALRVCRSGHMAGLVADGQRLPFRELSFDVVTCFEVIEHVPHPEQLLGEIERVLRPEGVLLLSTPNRRVRLFPLQRPWNAEHLREYGRRQLTSLLFKTFPFVSVLGVAGREEEYRAYVRHWRMVAARSLLVRSPMRRPMRVARRLLSGSRQHLEGCGDEQSRPVRVDPGSRSVIEEGSPFFVRKLAHPQPLNFLAVCGERQSLVSATAASLEQTVSTVSHDPATREQVDERT